MIDFEDAFFIDLLDALYASRKVQPASFYDEIWNASLHNSLQKICSFFGRKLPENYAMPDEHFFEDVVAILLSVRITNPTLYEHKAWNSALRCVLIKLYAFFNAGEMPDEISELFLDSIAAPGTTEEIRHDHVNHPSHYCTGGIETLDYILAKKMDFLLGQVCKYISRAGLKDPAKELEDLEKARFYLDKKIEELKK